MNALRATVILGAVNTQIIGCVRGALPEANHKMNDEAPLNLPKCVDCVAPLRPLHRFCIAAIVVCAGPLAAIAGTGLYILFEELGAQIEVVAR